MEQLIIAVVMLVVSFVITAITMPKPQDAKPAGLADFNLPQTDEGTPQAVVFGDAWTEDWQVLWYGDYRTEAIKGKGKK